MEAPFTHWERATIEEVFAGYRLTPAQEEQAWTAIIGRWHATSGRFYPYTIAHEIAARIGR